MKIFALSFICAALMTGSLFADAPASGKCPCKDCKCTAESGCGCCSGKECSCGDTCSCTKQCKK